MNTCVRQAYTPSGQLCDEALGLALDHLRQGHPVALPSETVYGLAADATSEVATARIFECKERPRFDPLIVHLSTATPLEEVALVPKEDRERVIALIEQFWPGPLTILLPKAPCIPDLVTSGSSLVALRSPAEPVFQAVLAEFGKPLAAPSANRFGRVSPTDAAAVVAELGGRIPLVLDGGCTRIGLESTIVALTRTGLSILRPGPITAEMLATFCVEERGAQSLTAKTPGSMASHYAPATPLRVFKKVTPDVVKPYERVGVIYWGLKPSLEGPYVVAVPWSLDAKEPLVNAASRLFGLIRALDSARLDLIAVEEVPREGMGVAIMDRIERAAARR